MLLATLPNGLDNSEFLWSRHIKAQERKDRWRSTYQECYKYAMPAREQFTWQTEGQLKNNVLYDSTLQSVTYEAANTTCALLFPSWQRWMELAPGGDVDATKLDADTIAGMQRATDVFFNFINHSNFQQAINEVVLDLMAGTGALNFEETPYDDRPFNFCSVPLPVLELEEGPDGTVENTFVLRKIQARHLVRMYKGLTADVLSPEIQDMLANKPDTEVEVLQCELYNPKDQHYYGVAILSKDKRIIWRYDYGTTCPVIVGRASKLAGETYGRGRALIALSDAKTLDKMQEFVLRHSAMQIAPPYTAVSDGVINPYTTRLFPNTPIPVASNDNGNPSLRLLETGGNFAIGDKIMSDIRERIRRTMLGPEMSDGAIKSATEISLADRNRLWAMNGEYNRIMSELAGKIVARGMDILARRGLVPEVKIDGQLISVKWTSPFARTQASQDVTALQQAMAITAAADPTGQSNLLGLSFKTENLGEWASRKYGVDMTIVRSDVERQAQADKMTQAAQAAMAQAQAAQGGGAQPQQGAAPPGAGALG